jgi:hypothetical protein
MIHRSIDKGTGSRITSVLRPNNRFLGKCQFNQFLEQITLATGIDYQYSAFKGYYHIQYITVLDWIKMSIQI